MMERADMLFDPTTEFDERFTAVLTDMLAGKHVNQLGPDGPGLFDGPVDNDDNPTSEF